MTIPRSLQEVNGLTPPAQVQAHAWGRTSGGGTPTLDTPSWGTSSITDVSVGVLDVTWERAFADANYQVNCSILHTGGASNAVGLISDVTVPTSTVARLICRNFTAITFDPGLGYSWLAYGV